jgi:hypothetical protein
MSSNYLKVYLCTQTSVWSYDCQMFNNFLEADEYYTQNYHDTRYKSTMLPICNYIPRFLHRPILNYKLGQMHKVNIK